ncbi:MAG: hypothetical protein QOE86_4177 [Solirubrobacteraceae bacterium]|nr:hypothetical protein [Solirubrobacteraceae bacterium]
MTLAAVPNSFQDDPERPTLRLVRPALRLVPAPRMTQREMVVASLMRCPDAPSRSDLR